MAANTSLSARLSTAETSHLGAGAAALAIAGLITASPKVRKALFTREDVFNFHKTLGMSCMISYAYRFSQVGDADMGFGPTVGTLGSIVLHMTLSVSSMIFKIPRKRSLSLYRIWPEYRLHSIVFAWRALLAMLITWAEAKLGLEPQYALNMALVIVCFMASDYASASVGEHASKSIRDLPVPPVVQFAASWLQFHMTQQIILGVRRYSVMFVYVLIIQVNAFLMTVQRKNLGSVGSTMGFYFCMLVVGYYTVTSELVRAGGWPLFLASNALGNAAAVARMSGSWLGGHKYLMWSLVGVITHLTRHTFESGDTDYLQAWLAAFVLTYGAVGTLGYRKVMSKYYQKTESGSWAKHPVAQKDAAFADAKHLVAQADANAKEGKEE